MPTGGVSADEENLKAWFTAGVSCVGMGSKLVRKDFINSEDYTGLQEHVREVLERIQSIRKEKEV
jgi:2-dehydro-3-deoxyphosphogluconate aldolase/(4S)-4-hydroxy-2-oxoglutarate aldolase